MSEWLAVDLEGNVGFFDPRSDGDVPMARLPAFLLAVFVEPWLGTRGQPQ